MEKRYGATERDDRLMQIGRQKWELIYGYGTDGESSWNWRKRYLMRKPSMDEIKEEVRSTIDAETRDKIVNRFVFNGVKIYLSDEKQRNYAAIQSNTDITFPLTLKVNEEEDATPVYYTFATREDFDKFSKEASAYILNTIMDGWKEKDAVDWSKFE